MRPRVRLIRRQAAGAAVRNVTAFINLFPGSSELGLELASVFGIVTSMPWNMAFAFYHSLVAQPRDLDEAARVMRPTKWQRFWQVDVPSGIILLVWNGMMGFGGAWVFLAASESISVLNRTYALPGIGSYVPAAIARAGLGRVGAVVVMVAIWIGMNPRVSRLAQPVVGVLASFPANFPFPFAAAFFITTGLSL